MNNTNVVGAGLLVLAVLSFSLKADELSAFRKGVGLLNQQEIRDALGITEEQTKKVNSKYREIFTKLASYERKMKNLRNYSGTEKEFSEEKFAQESQQIIELAKKELKGILLDFQVEKLIQYGRQYDLLTFLPSNGLLEDDLAKKFGVKGELRDSILKIDREYEKKIKALFERQQKEYEKLLRSRDKSLKEALGKEKAGIYENYFGEPAAIILEAYIQMRSWVIKEHARKHEGYKN